MCVVTLSIVALTWVSAHSVRAWVTVVFRVGSRGQSPGCRCAFGGC